MQILSLKTHNFKLLGDRTFTDFQKYNYIKGKNGTGKTSFFDALNFAFTKKTYSNSTKGIVPVVFNDPDKEITDRSMSVTVEFVVNDTKHIITRSSNATSYNSVRVWTTVIDGKTVKETAVEQTLTLLGVAGLDKWPLYTNPLALINPANYSSTVSQNYLYTLVNEIASQEIHKTLEQLAKFPYFSADEIRNLQADPTYFDTLIDNLSSNPLLKDYDTVLKTKTDDFSALQKTLVLLTPTEKEQLQTTIAQKEKLIQAYQQIDRDNAKIDGEINVLKNQITSNNYKITNLQNQTVNEHDPRVKAKRIIMQQINDVLSYTKSLWSPDAVLQAQTKKAIQEIVNLATTPADQAVFKQKALNLAMLYVLPKSKLNAFQDAYIKLSSNFAIETVNNEAEINVLVNQNKDNEAKITALEQKHVASKALETATLRAEVEELKAKLTTDTNNVNLLAQAKKTLTDLQAANQVLADEKKKITLLKKYKDLCLQAITDAINKRGNLQYTYITLFSKNKNGLLTKDFKIRDKQTHCEYNEMNEAQRWVCGNEIAEFFQTFSHVDLPLFVDGAERFDMDTLAELRFNVHHQLFLAIVRDQAFEVVSKDQLPKVTDMQKKSNDAGKVDKTTKKLKDTQKALTSAKKEVESLTAKLQATETEKNTLSAKQAMFADQTKTIADLQAKLTNATAEQQRLFEAMQKLQKQNTSVEQNVTEQQTQQPKKPRKQKIKVTAVPALNTQEVVNANQLLIEPTPKKRKRVKKAVEPETQKIEREIVQNPDLEANTTTYDGLDLDSSVDAFKKEA